MKDRIHIVSLDAPLSQRKTIVWKKVTRFVKTMAVAVLFALIFRLFCLSPVVIDGQSMMPNIHDGEHVVINKMVYAWGVPKRGDIVCIESPPTVHSVRYVVKRVIGLPGETIEVRGDTVSVNGVVLKEPFLDASVQLAHNMGQSYNTQNYAKTTIPIGHVFVMGDNRAHSYDSRAFGFVPLERVVGRVDVVLWPFDRIHVF